MTRIGSLFSGYGGLDMAVQWVYGGEVVWYSEIDRAAGRVLAHHYPGVPNLGDITAVNWHDVSPVDVLTGGYPCQPFSHAGQRKGTEDERHLWPYVRDAIVALRPMVTVLENVDGHRSLGLADVLGDLATIGMSARWIVVRAADAGAPHGRKRIFIIVTDPAGGGRNEDVIEPGNFRAPQGEGESGVVDGHRADGPAADADRKRHGGGQGPGEVEGMGSQAEGIGWSSSTTREVLGAGGDLSPTDANGAGSQGKRTVRRDDAFSSRTSSIGSVSTYRAAADADDTGDTLGAVASRPEHGSAEPPGSINWGKYAPAIERWERLTRPAPAPTIPGVNGRPRLSPYFVEWMMGLPEGHVTGHGLRPAQELKMLGNGVVPQQAALALRMLGVTP